MLPNRSVNSSSQAFPISKNAAPRIALKPSPAKWKFQSETVDKWKTKFITQQNCFSLPKYALEGKAGDPNFLPKRKGALLCLD